MPATTPWYVGVQVPVPPAPFVLTDTTGNPQDATGAVVVTITLPDGTTATPAVTHAGLGTYQATYTTTQPGHHIVSWSAAGTTPGAYTDTFEVQPSTDQTIVSLAEAKEILHGSRRNMAEDPRRPGRPGLPSGGFPERSSESGGPSEIHRIVARRPAWLSP